MNFLARMKFGARAFWEATRYRQGRPRIATTYQSAREDYTRSTRQRLQELARYWERNSALVNRLADLFECYVVGPQGLRVNPASADAAWNENALAWWKKWERYADVATLQGFGVLQGMVAREWFIDGEAFIIKVQGDNGIPRLQVIEAHRVETPPEKSTEEGVTVCDGVQIDTVTGRPTGYWVWTPDAKKQKAFRLIPAEMVIHVFEPSRAGQYRGIPFLSSALNTLDDLDELKRLELKAARAAAVVANIIENAAGEFDPVALYQNGGAISQAASGEVTAYQQRLGGETIALRAGEKLTQFKSDRPSVVTREYWSSLQAEICAACGIPAILVFPDTMQGTQYRGSLDMASTFFRARSAVMQEVVRRVYEWVMGYAIREIGKPPEYWYAVSIQPPRAVNVDVGRNSAAMLAELAAGVTNYELIYAPEGLDWREEMTALAAQREYAKGIGLIASGGGDVQVTALNGAQVASVLTVIQQVTSKQLGPESAKQLLYIALPTTDKTLIDRMVDEASDFEPEVLTVQAPTQPATDTNQ